MATPSRIIEKMVDVLLRSVPSKVRPVNERIQADEIYVAGGTIRVSHSFLVVMRIRTEIALHRYHLPGSPLPIHLYLTETPILSIRARTVHLTTTTAGDVLDPLSIPKPTRIAHGTRMMGRLLVMPIAAIGASSSRNDFYFSLRHYSENVLALEAPSTTKCDFCQVSFCGIGIPGRCVAAPILQQHLHGLADLGDLVQCSQIYDSFDGNTVEVDIMLDYLTAQRINPRFIYREVRSYSAISTVLFDECHTVSLRRLSCTYTANPGSSRLSLNLTCSRTCTRYLQAQNPDSIPPETRFAVSAPQRFSCGAYVIGGSGRGARASSRKK